MSSSEHIVELLILDGVLTLLALILLWRLLLGVRQRQPHHHEEPSRPEHALTESELRANEQFAEIEHLYRTAPIGLALVDRDLKYRRVNDQLAEINGLPAGEHIGKTFAEVIPAMAVDVEKLVRRVMETGEPVLNHEMHGTTPAATSVARDWLVSYFPLHLVSGDLHGVTIVVNDITRLKQTEREATLQQAYFEKLVESSPEAIAIVDTKNIVKSVNHEFTRFYGYEPAEAIGRNLDDLIVPEDKKEEGKWLDGEADRGVTTGIESVRRRKDGTRVDVSVLIAPVNVAEGHIAVYCIYRDITTRKRAEDALIESEERYRRLVDLSPDAIWVQCEGKIIFCNPACQNLVGATASAQLIGKNVLDIIHPDYHSIVKLRMSESQKPGQSVPFMEEKIVRLDGKVVDVEIAATSFSLGNRPAAQVIVHDLTERKVAERDLRAAETKFRTLVEQLPAITYMAEFGLTGRWFYVSPQIESILGIKPSEWLADKNAWSDALHPDDRGRAEELEELCRLTGEPFTYDYRLRARDGSYRWIRDVGVKRQGAHGVAESVQGVMMDVTETKRLEAQIRQSQRMEAIGQLAGGIAHDFNNVLMVIRGHTDLLLGRAAQNPLDNVAQIQRAADRAAALTRQLLAFSRMQVLQPEVLDLNTVVEDMAKMLPPLFGSEMELVVESEPGLGRVRADVGQIEQVILNLAMNARDAMPNGGRLAIHTANVLVANGDKQHNPAPKPGRYVALVVKDTGNGMDAETQAHIFEPFFTTKEKGRGTGLGLATVYGIVKQSEGYIWVESAPGRGTTFTMYLPTVDAPSKATAAPRPADAPSKSVETILVVDDEEGIRELASEYLARCGYKVLAAGDGTEAKEIADQHSGPIHLLLTDTVMPRMGGNELVRAITSSRPQMRVIYMSGFLEFNASAHLKNDASAFFLQKPFSLDALAKKVREALQTS